MLKGANYYSVHTAEDFKSRMGEQFEYMVTPLVFDLELNLQSKGYEIKAVYGSDTVNKTSGEIMKVNTLFPSKTNDDGEVKGGVILLKLKKTSKDDNNEITLNVKYKDRSGKQYSNEQKVNFSKDEEYYENSGIRKAIALTRYVNVLKNGILYERFENKEFVIKQESGIMDCKYLTQTEIVEKLGENERR